MRYIRGPPANEWNENFYLIPCKWFYRVFNNRTNSCYHFENRNINNFAITIWSVSHVTLLKGLERRRVPECPGDQAPYCESHWNSFMYWFFFLENFIVMSLFALFTSSSSKLNETLRQKMNLNNKNRELTFLAGYVAKFHMMLRLSGMSWNNVRRAKVKNRQYLRSSWLTTEFLIWILFCDCITKFLITSKLK